MLVGRIRVEVKTFADELDHHENEIYTNPVAGNACAGACRSGWRCQQLPQARSTHAT